MASSNIIRDDPRRERGVTLRLLDFAPLLDLARARAEQDGSADDPRRVSVRVGFPPYALAEHNGQTYVICGEGVGWTVSDDESFAVDLYVEHEGEIAMLPKYSVNLTPRDLASYATGATVDLADHVRRFGSRLESNFALWYHRLTS